LKPYLGNRKTYSKFRYIFVPNPFSQILFVLLKSKHLKARDDSDNGKIEHVLPLDTYVTILWHCEYESTVKKLDRGCSNPMKPKLI
jgi:hypothetical protein